ncbi:hypothetical protein [Rahnella sp. BCC 1045]|uniref:hypothetical protein n=1 Tax=Rahnella sp. BCC 1045 TaxID=2816251 RepID=UPI0020B8F2B8|nr:hypothetical protein [Rahnella sp. BCC 1045]
MVNKIAVALTALILMVIAILMWAAFHYYGKTISQQSEISVATQAKNQAEFITNSQALSVSIFNTIAGATLNEQHANTLDSQAAQNDIKDALTGDACAPVVVPARANDRVLDRYNSVRKGTGNANTSQPSPVMPAITTTK